MPISLVNHCAVEMGVHGNVVRRIAMRSPEMYKVWRIPKKKKGEWRTVAQPAREVKALQRAVVKFMADKFPIHSSATAYVSGASISKNAALHAGAKHLLKMDFSNFFGSLRYEDLSNFFMNGFGSNISDVELRILCRALTWRSLDGKLVVCIGAPSSPFISNIVMYRFDKQVYDFCGRLGAVYSRYSDDISVSAPTREVLVDVEAKMEESLLQLGLPELRFNRAKRVQVGRGSSMKITGIHLTTQGGISVGRERKRGIRSGVCRFLNGELNAESVLRLQGEIAFAVSSDPGFAHSLETSYGKAVHPILPKRYRS